MAQTDARAGFRLPWSSDRQSAETADAESAGQPSAAGWPTDESAAPANPSIASEQTSAAAVAPAIDPWTGVQTAATAPQHDAGGPTPALPPKKPSKFLADLTRAMQAAAEDARGRALTQLQAEAKTHVEAIHGRSSTEAANLRRKADDDVAAVREWSKAEIARIREETETRITNRKARLESEIEEHAAVIEREIDAVQKTVAAFEDEMAAFFERLLGEQDPTRFATMAENLPEPPSFEGIVSTPLPVETEAEPVLEPVEAAAGAALDGVAEPAVDAVPEPAVEDAVDEAVAADAATTEAIDAPETTVGTGEAGEAISGEATTVEGAGDSPASFGAAEGFDGDGEFDGEVDREAAFAAIQAAAEAAASAEVAADAAARAEAVADVAIEIIGNHEEEGEADPRFAVLGLSADYDAAEAEALAAAGSSDEEIPEVSNEAIEARLAGLGKTKGATDGATSTQVVVVGLISVASIASFKRHLGRVSGVNSVGVSSGPDGEFVFAVSHNADVSLKDVIPSLPSFQARVTSSADGVVQVTAHDPEADA